MVALSLTRARNIQYSRPIVFFGTLVCGFLEDIRTCNQISFADHSNPTFPCMHTLFRQIIITFVNALLTAPSCSLIVLLSLLDFPRCLFIRDPRTLNNRGRRAALPVQPPHLGLRFLPALPGNSSLSPPAEGQSGEVRWGRDVSYLSSRLWRTSAIYTPLPLPLSAVRGTCTGLLEVKILFTAFTGEMVEVCVRVCVCWTLGLIR